MKTLDTNPATLFRSLHHSQRPLALSNVWDVASARIVEAAGAPAIATTSGGVAWSLGRSDGEALDRIDAVAAIRRIAAAVDVPVTADIEGGYASSTAGVVETVTWLLEAGVVGINIEDGHRSPAELAARIGAARRAAETAGVDLFINARTDVFLLGDPPAQQQVQIQIQEVLRRAGQYVEAGADGLFVPGASTPESIAAITAGVCVPVNVMAGPGSLSVAELGRLGVARVSVGTGIAQAAYLVARRAAQELIRTGTYGTTADALAYDELNELLAPMVRR